MKKIVIAAAALALSTAPALAGKDLDAVKARGKLICGVNTSLAGFSVPDSQGRWTGLDVDVCRAVAAAMFGDATKVDFKPTTAQQRFTALQTGEVDILSRNTTWTLTRDASLGMAFTGVTFYDGQGFMVDKKHNIKSAKELAGAEICVQSGTTTELNLADFLRANKINAKTVVFEKLEESKTAFFNGRCQAYTTDASGLASIRATDAKNPDQYHILPELISKEPLGPAVRQGDPQWFMIVRWAVNAMIEAEELGITQANVDEMRSKSTNPNIRRLLGADEKNDMGKLLGLKADWAYQIVKQVGNYGEIFDRNVGPKTSLKLERGVNALWSKGGLMYAPPVR